MKRLDRLQRGCNPRRQGRGLGGQIDALRVGIAHVGGEDAAAIRCFPGERHAIDLERDAAPDGGMPKAELVVKLRHLGRVAKRVGKVTDPHRAAVRLSRGDSALQVAHQRLPADQEFIRQRVPGPDLDLPATNGRLEPNLRLRPDLEIIIDHDRLAVHQESEIGIRVGQRQQLVPELDELGTERLKGRIPFAIPMRVRHDVDGRGPVGVRHALIVRARRPTRAAL